MNKLSHQEAKVLIKGWQESPLSYCRDVLDVDKTWELQDNLLASCPRAINEHKHIYVASGHSLGKDYICSAISLWFLHSYSPSIVIQTAPTDRQVKKIMWGETMRHWNNKKLDLGGTPYSDPYLEIVKESWYLLGFTTKDTGAAKESGGGKFQGFHSPNICVIVSEAQAVEDAIYDQVEGITTSENVLVIYIGNPTRARGQFAKGLRNPVDNIVFNFSCLDNPNYKQRKTVVPGLASYHWVENKRKLWGTDDPRWQGRVLGQIPDVAVNNVLGPKDINQMKERHGFLAQHSMNGGVAVDPAGEGIDYNEFVAGKGGEVTKTLSQSNMAPSVVAMKAVEMCKEIDGSFIVVDCDGIGIGTYQELMKMSDAFLEGIEIIKFHGSARLPTELKGDNNYYNKRVEAAFITQKRARQGFAAIDGASVEMIEDLMEDEYFEKNGFIHLIPKDEIKERLGRSPGKGDAYKMLQWGFEQDIKPLTCSFGEREVMRQVPMRTII